MRAKDPEFRLIHLSIKITLWEDRVYPHLCPIILFLSIAFEHGAFELEPEDLFRTTLDRDVVEVNFKDAVLDTPLFRSSDGLSPWTYAGCYGAVRALAYRAGYRCTVSSYAIRRGCVNALKGGVALVAKGESCTDLILDFVTSETGLLLGHKNPKTTQAHYMNKHLSIDLQSAHRHKPARTDRLRPLRSLAAERFPAAPTSIRGTKMHQELRQHPEYLALRQIWKDHKQNGASKPLIHAAKSKMEVKLALLRKKATDQLRSEWIKGEVSRYLRTDNPGQSSAEESCVLPTWRATVVDLLYHSVDQSQEYRLKLLFSLRKLATIHCEGQMVFPCPHTDCKRHHEPFKAVRALERHKLLHEGTVYPCPHADCERHRKPFKKAGCLERHLPLHEGTTYLCPYIDCDRHQKSFQTAGGLERHRMLHEDTTN